MHDPQLHLPYSDSTIDQIHHELRRVSITVQEIAASLPQQRRPLADGTKAIHLRVTWERRAGWCPCCQLTPVCDSSGKLPQAEFDHWYGRHRNASSETWLVCCDCNRQLENAEFKTRARSAFEAYQAALEVVVRAMRQASLFDPT